MLQCRVLKICLFLTSVLLPIIGMRQAIAADVPDVPTDKITISQPITEAQTDGWGLRPMDDSEFASTMCVLGATAGMAMTYAAGPNEVIMLVVGGVVVPSSPTVLFLSLFGTMAAAGCTIGALSTPAVSWLYQRYQGN